jgi:hypothetical protein
MSGRRDREFELYERRGEYGKEKLVEAPTLEEVHDFLDLKLGGED